MPTFPTLSMDPNIPIDPDGVIEDAVLRSPTSAGYEITRPKWTRARRVWGVRYNALPDADAAILRDFEITTLANGALSFTWTHPKGSPTVLVRLAGPIAFTTIMRNRNQVAFTVREV